jgi:DNA-binding transcriptional LysR family regulator
MNWDDTRVVLAISRGGSFAAAAEELGLDETTVARRLKRFETATKVKIFVRRGAAQCLTEAGAGLVRQAERLEVEAKRLEAISAQCDRAPAGKVRLTATPPIARHFIAPALPRLYAACPDIQLVLICRHENLSFSRWETDMAVRLSRPIDGNLVVKRLAEIPSAVYGPAEAAAVARLHARPDAWVTYVDQFAHIPSARYVAQQLKGRPPALQTDDSDVLAIAAAAGIGRTVLSCRAGEAHAGLKRQSSVIAKREAWLLIHPDLHELPAIRSVTRWLTEAFAKVSPLEQQCAPAAVINSAQT